MVVMALANTATIGVCFDWQIVDSIPSDQLDMPVKAVVTDLRRAHRPGLASLLAPKDTP